MKTALPTVDPADFMPDHYEGPGPEHWPGVCWHYTRSPAAKRIVADGTLKPQPQGYVNRETPLDKKPILWFSKNHIWEPAACKGFAGLTFEWNGMRLPKAVTFEGAQSFGTKLVRFAVSLDKAPYSHFAAFALAGFSKQASRFLVHAGEQLGGVHTDWRGTLDPVPKADWLSIEVWNGTSCQWEVVWEP